MNKQSTLTQNIMLAQALDHIPVFFMILLFMASGFSLFPSSTQAILQNAGSMFWMGFFSLCFFWGLIYRVSALFLFDATLGQYLLGLRYKKNTSLLLSMGMILESLQIVFPPLWVLDHLSRRFQSPLNPHYEFYYHFEENKFQG